MQVCLTCDAVLTENDLLSRRCFCCGVAIDLGDQFNLQALLFLVIASLLLFLGLFVPFLDLQFSFYIKDLSLSSVVFDFNWLKYWWLGMFLFLFLFLLPLLYWLGILYLLIPLVFGYRLFGSFACMRLICFLRAFRFLDVFFFSILVALIKVANLGRITFYAGIFGFLLLVVFDMWMNFYWSKKGFYLSLFRAKRL